LQYDIGYAMVNWPILTYKLAINTERYVHNVLIAITTEQKYI